jgi:hypothetical protein
MTFLNTIRVSVIACLLMIAAISNAQAPARGAAAATPTQSARPTAEGTALEPIANQI